MGNKPYEIQQVARMSGVNRHRIRAWERRYGAVVPERTSGNRRVYDGADIRRLTLLDRAVAAGHRISRIAGLDDAALQDLTSPAGRVVRSETQDGKKLDKMLCEAGFEAVCRMDAPALYDILAQAAVSLPVRQVLCEVVQPLLARIGAAWAQGDLKIANEHMASAAVRALLGELLRDAMPATGAAPLVVVGTPSGHRHELGAIGLALTAAEAGWQPLFLGADLPAADMAAAAAQTAARGVALSVSHALDPARTARELWRLRGFLPPETMVFAGGEAASGLQGYAYPGEIRWCDSLSAFQADLDAAARQAGGHLR